MIEIKNISFSYKKGKEIFKKLSCKFNSNKLISIVGPNGCGKSTLIKMLSNSITDYNGSITINNKNIKDFSFIELYHKISYLPQKITYDPDITVIESFISMFSRDFIFEPNQYHKDKINRIINKLDLKSIKDSKLSQISGGELQRVFIGMCMTKDADIYLFDEPLNNLDIKNQIDIMRIIKEISTKKTVIIILHDINMAINFSDEIAFMKDGSIVFYIKPQEINEYMIETIFDVKLKLINIDTKKTIFYC